jgi:thiamine kinase-like enzyme
MTDHEIVRIGDGLVLKRYRQVDRDQPGREWRALRLLDEYAPGLAPKPVTGNLRAALPSITMGVVAGVPLGDGPVSPPEMRAIAEALHRLHTCLPRDTAAGIPLRDNDPQAALGHVADRLAQQRRPSADAVAAMAYDEAMGWLSSSAPGQVLGDEPVSAVLGRGDHNLSNFLWDGQHMHLVDFEYSGRSDRCAEIADLVEHLSARGTPERAWQALLNDLDFSRSERKRLLAVRRLLAAMWFLMLLPGQSAERRNPPGTLQMQAQRLLSLLQA